MCGIHGNEKILRSLYVVAVEDALEIALAFSIVRTWQILEFVAAARVLTYCTPCRRFLTSTFLNPIIFFMEIRVSDQVIVKRFIKLLYSFDIRLDINAGKSYL